MAGGGRGGAASLLQRRERARSRARSAIWARVPATVATTATTAAPTASWTSVSFEDVLTVSTPGSSFFTHKGDCTPGGENVTGYRL